MDAAFTLAEKLGVIGPLYPTVDIPESDLACSTKKWETSLVPQFSNAQPLSFTDLKARLLDGSWHADCFSRPIWSFVRSKVEAFSLGSRLFRFSSVSDLSSVMIRAPFVVDGRLLLLQRWKRGIDPTAHTVAAAPIWLYIIRLPIEFWNEALMRRVAGTVGPVVDSFRDLISPDGDGAEVMTTVPRVLVEVDFAKELVMGTNVPVDDGGKHFVVFGYEHKARVCVWCNGSGVGIRYPLCPQNGRPIVIVPPMQAAAALIVRDVVSTQQEQDDNNDDDEEEEEASEEEEEEEEDDYDDDDDV